MNAHTLKLEPVLSEQINNKQNLVQPINPSTRKVDQIMEMHVWRCINLINTHYHFLIRLELIRCLSEQILSLHVQNCALPMQVDVFPTPQQHMLKFPSLP